MESDPIGNLTLQCDFCGNIVTSENEKLSGDMIGKMSKNEYWHDCSDAKCKGKFEIVTMSIRKY